MLKVSPLGLGLAGMGDFYGPIDDKESLKTLELAIDLGVNFFDSADVYGFGRSESMLKNLLNKLEIKRDEIVIGTKCGFDFHQQSFNWQLNGHPDYIIKSCEESLLRLGIDTIDIFYLHRIDPKVPLSDSLGAMKKLLDQGKIRGVGLCEVDAFTLEKAHKICPITALQSEYSLFVREIEEEILPTCKRLGILFVAYSPLARGLLSGKITNYLELQDNDIRKNREWFSKENLQLNLQRVQLLEDLCEKKNCSKAQLALAYILHQGKSVIAIPGAKRRSNLKENLGSLKIKLFKKEIEELKDNFPFHCVHGDRNAF